MFKMPLNANSARVWDSLTQNFLQKAHCRKQKIVNMEVMEMYQHWLPLVFSLCTPICLNKYLRHI